jgi:hypothetical protein
MLEELYQRENGMDIVSNSDGTSIEFQIWYGGRSMIYSGHSMNQNTPQIVIY